MAFSISRARVPVNDWDFRKSQTLRAQIEWTGRKRIFWSTQVKIRRSQANTLFRGYYLFSTTTFILIVAQRLYLGHHPNIFIYVVTQTSSFGSWQDDVFKVVTQRLPFFLTTILKRLFVTILFPQEHMLELFFAMFYASVNVGAVLCMWFIPMVRSESSFYGDLFQCSSIY